MEVALARHAGRSCSACRGTARSGRNGAGAAREDLVRIGVEIPVEQVEMMRRLVHEQAAGILDVGVPAAEVVGAVLDVEIPVEVDRGDRRRWRLKGAVP